MNGKVVDVIVDLRKDSPTYKKWLKVELSFENGKMLYVPRGFAHGFLVLSKEVVFTYKVDNVYAPQSEAGIRWNDPDLGIKWPIDSKDILTSEKDMKQPYMKDAVYFD